MVTRKIYFLVIILIVSAGCKKLNPTPEAGDPVYQDFLSMAEKAKKDAEAKEKELDADRERLANTPDDSYEKKLARSDVFDAEKAINKLRQLEKYYELSAESRQIYDRKQNIEYFKRGDEWKPEASAELYFREKQLASQPKRWSRGEASVEPIKPEKKEAPKEE